MGGESVRARAARPRARRLRATRAVAARRALALRPSPFALHLSLIPILRCLPSGWWSPRSAPHAYNTTHTHFRPQ
ncbi:hypothetical protein DIJ60_37495 [Burkholderia pseudomallei]|nr:hypothetical protein DIJ60_37495 [Burkholderia pseudomallei]